MNSHTHPESMSREFTISRTGREWIAVPVLQ
jgi:hypothetical protein